MEDTERGTVFYSLAFGLAEDRGWKVDDRGSNLDSQASTRDPQAANALPIATTRPELLPACVAVFVHPEDPRYAGLIGGAAIVPLVGRRVPILADAAVDPAKGSGAVMCCTFGDTTDVAWWRAHSLPHIPLVTRDGRLSEAGGPYAGLELSAARARIVADLRAAGALLAEQPAAQAVRVHERCGTPLEILDTSQWFVRLLDMKPELLAAGRRIAWHPAHMRVRYEHWVENLGWDWCISRQRFYGVPFPAWHCAACGAVVLADEAQLPVDPQADPPPGPCACGSRDLRPDLDVMDTWATSSVSPQIALRFLEGDALPPPADHLPMQLRPQAHDIIRTWAFYTIAKSLLHFGRIPWETILIAGHGLDPHGRKVSKSKGNTPLAPDALIERYGADAVRYWACGGAPGADQALAEDEMRQGARLVAKLWNAARLLEAGGWTPEAGAHLETNARLAPHASPSDRALLSWLQRLIERATAAYRAYDYVAARDMAERFFWSTLCDNYLELAKARLYSGSPAARAAFGAALRATLQVLAPIMPHVTEEIYRRLFAPDGGSIHTAAWPAPDAALLDPEAERAGEALLLIAGAVRRAKTARKVGLGTPLAQLSVAAADAGLRALLRESAADLRSVSRASEATFAATPGADWEELAPELWATCVF